MMTAINAPRIDVAANAPLGKKLSATIGSRGGKIFVWMLALVWTVPTFGLFVTSFRPEKQIKSTGWWTAFAHPQVTLDNYVQVLGKESGILVRRS